MNNNIDDQIKEAKEWNIKAEKYWLEFLKWANDDWKGKDIGLDISYPEILFRGMDNKKYISILPKIGRDNYDLLREINFLEFFKHHAIQFVKANNDFEWLAIAQHHGLNTRLLDWTKNPLVAAYFACQGSKENDGRIYKVRRSTCAEISKYKSPFEVPDLSFLYPPINTKRIDLQNGLFSIHPLPDHPTYINEEGILSYIDRDIHLESIENFLNEHYEKHSYLYFDIPVYFKNYFLRCLKTLGINELLFGDLDAICNFLGNQSFFNFIVHSININHMIPLIKEFIITDINMFLKQKNNIINLDYNNIDFDYKLTNLEITECTNESLDVYNVKGNIGIYYSSFLAVEKTCSLFYTLINILKNNLSKYEKIDRYPTLYSCYYLKFEIKIKPNGDIIERCGNYNFEILNKEEYEYNLKIIKRVNEAYYFIKNSSGLTENDWKNIYNRKIDFKLRNKIKTILIENGFKNQSPS